MFHQCIKCSRTYTEKAPELIKGCKCGARIFLVVKNQSGSEKLAGNAAWLEKELAGLLEKHGKPISLEVENIRMLKRGVFELNLKSLMSNDPIIIRDPYGIYYVKLPVTKSSVSPDL